MSEINKSYRINTNIGNDLNNDYITIDANLVQDYETFDILSVKIDSVDTYKLHNANYGVVVGRVLANNGFGVPNAKLSIFISSDGEDGEKVRDLYPFSSTTSKDRKGVRYNLLPNEQVDDCHQIVGTFPSKRYALDNDVVLEVFDKYYKYTTRTNNAGDYLIMGVPVGAHTLHMDLDLSDCGILSQRPRDFVYKGYTIEQFENPNMFKSGTTYSNLSQIFTQDQVVNVQPFWGNTSLGEKIGITRADINVAFKFEPTCVFIGSVISDNSSQGISKKCIATENMGNMEELTTGEGTIEMIRKTPNGAVEEFQVKGTQLIDGNGIWCYQIPMNLDYMMTDEYGNMVPTDDPEKGIPTRTKVRFRISMQDNEENVDNFFRAKVLVPHNPQNLDGGKHEEYDYEFGSLTRDDSFRDLFWNNVYSVKSYIPRFQKRTVGGWKEKKFTGIKNCNFYGSNNPMPYNNIRIKLPFMFTVMCALIKVFIFIVSLMNSLTSMLGNFLCDLGDTYIGFHIGKWDVGVYPFKKLYEQSLTLSMNVIKEGLCPDLDNWYFAPMFKQNLWSSDKKPPKDMPKYDLLAQTLAKIRDASADDDVKSIDYQNNEEMDDGGQEPVCLTIHTDYLIACVEMNLAMEYKVINFDFYNDWVNGTLYFPRFMRYVRPKKTFLGITFVRSKVKGCMDDTKIFSKTRRYTQQCALGYKSQNVDGRDVYTNVENPMAKKINIKAANNLHKQRGLSQKSIFGKNGGICHEQTTMHGQYVYYMKPCEWTYGTTPNARKVNLFATDIILLGSLSDCDLNGVPQAFKYLSSTSYVMPTNLALTNMENSGFLYATDNGTICAGKSQLKATDVKNDSRVRVVDPNKGLTEEILAFSGAQDFNYNVQYDGNELSDIIALTEAAGIAWNYTGPGQGEVNPKKMYYPGGHFLGLSCVNSQTNIKSCINLSRICEVGTNMSQRKEDITSIKDGEAKYTYTAPSGFISGDDIVGANFRTMFATMNYNRLIATKTNPNTGYKMYNFDFIKPINFDGAFKSVIKDNGLYNGKIDVPEENNNIWEKIGIDFKADSRPDYDKDEKANTQTRTIEDTSIDYYLYRFGLTYEELKKSGQKHQRRFLVSRGGKLYLPQYENSYYFYFGLKNGATAIDEFNKQFFSECANGMLLAGEPTVNISINGNINICNGSTQINVVTNNLEVPFQSIEIISDVAFFNGKKYLLVKNGDEDEKNPETVDYDYWLTNYMFTLGKENEPWNCPFGTYMVTIRDANDVVYTKTEKIGVDVLSFESAAYDFNTTKTNETSLTHRGGYIKVSNVRIDGLPDGSEDGESMAKLIVYIKNGVEEPFYNGSAMTKDLMVPSKGEYELRVKYRCDESSDDYVDMVMQTFVIKDNSGLGLYIGDPDVESSAMTISTHPYGWWTGMTSNDKWIERVSTFNEVLPSNRREEAVAIKVYAVGGTKAVWGHPQNSEKGIKTDVVWSSEDTSNWEDDYIMDDEYVHYPTYKYNGTEVKHFSATVYDGTMVMGDYCAILDDGKIKITDSEAVSKLMRDGCGYVFKPVPDGDLQFHVYNSKRGFTASTIDENGAKIKDGVFYPSISYPSVNRPFYALTRFFCWQRRALEMLPDETGEITPEIRDYEEGGRTEMKVYNGVTYYDGVTKNNKFYVSGNDDEVEGSYITNLDTCTFEVKDNDLYGVTSNKDRETIFSGFSTGVTTETIPASDSPYGVSYSFITGGISGVSTYGYEIIEGADLPVVNEKKNYKKLEMCNSIYDNVDSLFADYVRYSVDSSGAIIGPVPEGGQQQKGVIYHMAKVPNSSSSLIVKSDEKYIYAHNKKEANQSKIFYVVCTYTANSIYDEEGAPVVVKIETNNQPRYQVEKVWVTYKHKNEEGEVVEYKSGKIAFNRGEKSKAIIEIFDTVFSYCTGVTGMVDYRINNKVNDWEKLLKQSELKMGDDIYSDSNIYFAYATLNTENIKVNNNTVPKTVLYKIYPTPLKVSELKEPDFTSITIDSLIGETVYTVNSNGGSHKYQLYGSTTQGWTSSCDASWFKVSPSYGKRNAEITVTVNKSDKSQDREGKIYFYYQGENKKDSETYITIKQTGNKPDSYKYNITETVTEEFSTRDFKMMAGFSFDADDADNYTIELPSIGYSYTNNTGIVFTTITFEIIDENEASIAIVTQTDVVKKPSLVYNGVTINVTNFKKGNYGIKVYGTIGDIMPEETTLKIKRAIGSYKITRKK